MLHQLPICLLLFLFATPPSVNATVKCYKGFSGDGRPFKQRLCQTEYCIKTTEPTGGATYGCDDFTPFCKKTAKNNFPNAEHCSLVTTDECVVTSKQSEVCCCNTDLCNSSPMPLAVFSIFFFFPFLCLLFAARS